MPERWVVNVSPSIALGSIGRLDLLTSLADDVVVPEIVAEKLLRVADEAALAFSRSSLRRESVAADDSVNRWRLGPGETAVLSFAKRNAGFVAVLDDMAARRCAKAHGIETRGTVGVTLLAKSRGIIPLARPILEEPRDSGFYTDADLDADIASGVAQSQRAFDSATRILEDGQRAVERGDLFAMVVLLSP